MSKLKDKLVLVLLITACSVLAEKDTCEQLEGLWVFTEMNPVQPLNSNPRGTINNRWFFDAEKSKVYFSYPDDVNATDSDEGKSMTYQCDEGLIKLNQESVSEYSSKSTVISIKSITKNQLKLSIETFYQFSDSTILEQIYTRNHFQSIGDRFEPTSIAVLQYDNNDINIMDVEYDNNDYSDLPINQRIIGVWEVNRYIDFPKQDMPPYGHLNDIYTIKKDGICMLKRYPPEKIVCYPYTMKENTLTWNIDGKYYDDTISFNEWGHLEFDNNVTVQSFKLLNKDVSVNPQLPLKVVLTSFLINNKKRRKE